MFINEQTAKVDFSDRDKCSEKLLKKDLKT